MLNGVCKDYVALALCNTVVEKWKQWLIFHATAVHEYFFLLLPVWDTRKDRRSGVNRRSPSAVGQNCAGRFKARQYLEGCSAPRGASIYLRGSTHPRPGASTSRFQIFKSELGMLGQRLHSQSHFFLWLIN